MSKSYTLPCNFFKCVILKNQNKATTVVFFFLQLDFWNLLPKYVSKAKFNLDSATLRCIFYMYAPQLWETSGPGPVGLLYRHAKYGNSLRICDIDTPRALFRSWLATFGSRWVIIELFPRHGLIIIIILYVCDFRIIEYEQFMPCTSCWENIDCCRICLTRRRLGMESASFRPMSRDSRSRCRMKLQVVLGKFLWRDIGR